MKGRIGVGRDPGCGTRTALDLSYFSSLNSYRMSPTSDGRLRLPTLSPKER